MLIESKKAKPEHVFASLYHDLMHLASKYEIAAMTDAVSLMSALLDPLSYLLPLDNRQIKSAVTRGPS
jgi:hypothetical protein